MKNILVLAAGGDSDQAVFATALGLAQPLGAHLEFLHIQVDPGEAGLWQVPRANGCVSFFVKPYLRNLFVLLGAPTV